LSGDLIAASCTRVGIFVVVVIFVVTSPSGNAMWGGRCPKRRGIPANSSSLETRAVERLIFLIALIARLLILIAR